MNVLKLKMFQKKKEINTKNFVLKYQELILAEEKTLEKLVSPSHMLTNIDDFFK
ncbi:hypothetical protein [Spiroplasma citri]|uniref:hypothetical protein n=1 Tax=Spiroplasma citri TaxID=2133 RepID=UPI0020A2C441|nr:hypothetical protein [Spiroplasma citri]